MAGAAGRLHARFEIPVGADAAEAVHAALVPEADEGPEGSTIRLTRRDAEIRIDIEADDVSTLRAAMHSMLRLFEAARASVEPGHAKD